MEIENVIINNLIYLINNRVPKRYSLKITYNILYELVFINLEKQKKYAYIWDEIINKYGVYLVKKNYDIYSNKEKEIIHHFFSYKLNSNSYMHFFLKNLLLWINIEWFDYFLEKSLLDWYTLRKNKDKKHQWWTLLEIIIGILLEWVDENDAYLFLDYFFKDELKIILNKKYLLNKLDFKQWIIQILSPLRLQKSIMKKIIYKTIFFEFDAEFYETCDLFHITAKKLDINIDIGKFIHILKKRNSKLNLFGLQYSNIIDKETADNFILKYLWFRIIQKTKNNIILQLI